MNTADTSIQSGNFVLSPKQVGTTGSFPIFAFPWIEMPAIDDIFKGKTGKPEIEKLNFPKDTDIFELAKRYYLNNKGRLLKAYKGKYIAILNNKVIGSDKDFSRLAQRVYRKFGYQTIYMPLVEKKEEVVRIPAPRIKI